MRHLVVQRGNTAAGGEKLLTTNKDVKRIGGEIHDRSATVRNSHPQRPANRPAHIQRPAFLNLQIPNAREAFEQGCLRSTLFNLESPK